ncbi:hypothetical protein AAHC03_016551 [Spirometra sp. Aus1]
MYRDVIDINDAGSQPACRMQNIKGRGEQVLLADMGSRNRRRAHAPHEHEEEEESMPILPPMRLYHNAAMSPRGREVEVKLWGDKPTG